MGAVYSAWAMLPAPIRVIDVHTKTIAIFNSDMQTTGCFLGDTLIDHPVNSSNPP